MTPEALTAIKQSILKWERNARVRKLEDAKIGIGNCPLCNLFLDLYCHGCPVSERTDQPYCLDTPYVAAWRAHHTGDLPGFRKASKAEVAFLRSLLPEGETT